MPPVIVISFTVKDETMLLPVRLPSFPVEREGIMNWRSRFSKRLPSAFRSNRTRRIGRYLSELILAVATVTLDGRKTRGRVSVLNEGRKKVPGHTLVGSNLTGIKVIKFHIGWTFGETRGSRFSWSVPFVDLLHWSCTIAADDSYQLLLLSPSTWPRV